MNKVLNVTSPESAKELISDIQITGDPHIWKLISKASSESGGWMKTTKAMQVGGSVVLQTETQQRSESGQWSLSQGLVVVDHAWVKKNAEGLWVLNSQ